MGYARVELGVWCHDRVVGAGIVGFAVVWKAGESFGIIGGVRSRDCAGGSGNARCVVALEVIQSSKEAQDTEKKERNLEDDAKDESPCGQAMAYKRCFFQIPGKSSLSLSLSIPRKSGRQ